MTPKRAGEPGDDTNRIAREIAETLAALATPLPGASRSVGPGHAGGGGGFGLDGPRSMLENGARYVAPVLPADARARRAKALLLRALRIVTRDQTVFNSAVLESLRIAFREIEQGVGATRREAAEAGAAAAAAASAARAADARADGIESAVFERLRRAETDLLAVTERRVAALERLVEEKLAEAAAAHEAAGRERSATMKRVDRLELEADRRGPEVDALTAAAARLGEAGDLAARRVADLESERQTLRREVASIRLAVESAPRAADEPRRGTGAPVPVDAGDPVRAGQYVSFEETFRGSEEEIGRRQAHDVERFRGVAGPVADLGCGRGEFLSALAAGGLPGLGCDANPLMAEHARSRGLAVDRADLLEWLAERPDGSLGGITAFQVVEHLPTDALFRLVDLAGAKLSKGGILLLETVNPESIYAMKWFWMDLTHVRPVPGPSLAHLLTSAGFRDVAVEYRSPVPEGDRIPEPAAGSAELSPVSRLLFAPQDIAVVGTK